MSTFTLKLNKAQYGKIVKATFPEYTGRTVKIEFTDRITFYNTNWSGGSKCDYAAINSDGKTAKLNAPAPWINPIEGQTFELPENAMIVKHEYCCGQDIGIRVYAHTCHLPKWIEAPAA